MPFIIRFLALLLLPCMFCACAEQPATNTPANSMRLLTVEEWPLLEDDMSIESLEEAAAFSLDYLKTRSSGQEFIYGPHSYSAEQLAKGWQRVLELKRMHNDARAFTHALQKEFDLYQAVGQKEHNGQVLFTGYYEPVITGRLEAETGFEQPLYALPADLFVINLTDFDPSLPERRIVGQAKGNRLTPYPTREDIDFNGAIKDNARILAYIADPIDAFFLHIQGSGQIELADGGRIRLGYAGANGRPYRSIGNLLLQKGAMESHEMSMQNIRKYLEENPQMLREVLSYNPSYVFFRQLPAQGGPLGAYNRPVTAGRSIACDRSLFPPMALAFIRGTTPAAPGENAPLSRLVWAQDTGGAIKGPGRLDLFYGSGEAAGDLAGRMKNYGHMYFLAPKQTGPAK